MLQITTKAEATIAHDNRNLETRQFCTTSTTIGLLHVSVTARCTTDNHREHFPFAACLHSTFNSSLHARWVTLYLYPLNLSRLSRRFPDGNGATRRNWVLTTCDKYSVNECDDNWMMIILEIAAHSYPLRLHQFWYCSAQQKALATTCLNCGLTLTQTSLTAGYLSPRMQCGNNAIFATMV